MFGLRQKVLIGFGGLLLILLIVSGVGIGVLRQYRNALDRFLYDNWRSVEYARGMIDAVERIDESTRTVDARELRGAVAAPVADFERNLDAENRNITQPGEDALAAELTALWRGPQRGCRTTLDRLLDSSLNADERAVALAQLHALLPKVKSAVRAISKLNFDNMQPITGSIRSMSDKTSRLMVLLALAGAGLAVLFILLVSRLILDPVRTLTRSAREIERGNLDLVVQVNSRDELHQLAEAFNSMAAKLREYRRTNRAKLLRTQQTTQLAINSFPDAVAVLSPDGHLEMTNEVSRKLFGLRTGARVWDLQAPWLAELYEKTLQTLKPVEPNGYESALKVLDEKGGERVFLPHAVPILDADGEQQLLGVTIVLADVTNLRRLDEMKSGMLSVVSHELKTPLTSIRMGVHLLLEERVGSLTALQSELLTALREDSDRLHRIIENLLDMGRIESGGGLMQLRPESVEAIIADAAGPMLSAFADRGVRLSVEPPDAALCVLADITRIGHVLSNLLANALKYTPAGGMVRVIAVAEPATVRISVTDMGPGIPPQYHDRIFERFFRVPGQSGRGGAGLGLAIAREIVEAHGGAIEVESREGAGSTFSFTLRRADGPAEATASSLLARNVFGQSRQGVALGDVTDIHGR